MLLQSCLLQFVRYRTMGHAYANVDLPDFKPAVTLEDKIRDLCAQVLTARDDEAVNQLLPQLREAIHQHCENVRVMVERTLPRI